MNRTDLIFLSEFATNEKTAQVYREHPGDHYVVLAYIGHTVISKDILNSQYQAETAAKRWCDAA